MRVYVAKTFVGLEKFQLNDNEYYIEVNDQDAFAWPYKLSKSKKIKAYGTNEMFSYFYTVIVWMPIQKRWFLKGHPELTVNFLHR